MSSQSQNYIIGQQIGNYRLLSWLGQGSFADVYLGEHIHLKRHAAIKTLKVSLPDEARENFLNEARIVAGLDHPHIIRVLECGIDNTRPFLVMNYATRGSLRQRYPHSRRLSPDEALPYVQQAAAALHYSHQQKLIHRDVKPENMLLDTHSQLLLSDFGLVLIYQSIDTRITKEMAGTVSYMAPEQFQGKAQFASDQYALGVVTYEWLCGEYPFNGTFLEIASQHMLVPPPPLREKVPTLSEEVEQVVLRALSKDPAQRFADIEAFAESLAEAITGKLPVPVAIPLHAGSSGEMRSLSARNLAPSAIEQEGEVSGDAPDQQKDTSGLYPAKSPSSVLAGTQPVLDFSPASSSPHISFSTIPPTKHRKLPLPTTRPTKRRKLTLLLTGILIFLIGSASLGYNILSGAPLPGTPTQTHGSGINHTSADTPPRGTRQAWTTTRQVGNANTSSTANNATATSTANNANATPNGNTSPAPSPTPASTCISITPTSLTFVSIPGIDPATQVLTITNCGNTSAQLDYIKSSNWILVSSSDSTIKSGSSAAVGIAINSANAGLGIHKGSVTFSLGTANQTVAVTYTAT